MLVRILTSAGVFKDEFHLSQIAGRTNAAAAVTLTIAVASEGNRNNPAPLTKTVNVTPVQWENALDGNPPAGTPKSIGNVLLIQETS